MILYRYFHLAILLHLACSALTLAVAQTVAAPRVIVLTDISSLSEDEAEPDDGQSLIRFMLYTNELDVEGLIATSNLGHGQRTRPELIRQVINTYGKVRPNLLLHDPDFPGESELLSVVRQGQSLAGPKVQVDESIGHGKDTEGSEWIIRVVDRDDPRPVWILIWGGSGDLAQALWKVKTTRTEDQLKKFLNKLRIHAVYDQDQTGSWLKSEFPELFYIFRHHGIRGMYRGGDTTLVRSNWVENNIRKNHGALGELYTNYKGGDIWGRKLGRVFGIKEGDTPSFLYLIENGLNVPEHPEWGNWSGRFRRHDPSDNLWVEAVDSVADYKTDPDPRMAALYRWRSAWQADFAARLDWCVSNYQAANHVPRLEDATVKEVTVSPRKRVTLVSPKASDPDNDELHYKWYFYPEAGTYDGVFPLLKVEESVARLISPRVTTPQSLHIILEVTDSGSPALTTYKRFIVRVIP